MKKKIYITLGFMFIFITFNTIVSYGVTNSIATQGSDLNVSEKLESVRKEMKDISTDYVADESDMHATIKTKIVQKKGENGIDYYVIKNGDKEIPWTNIPIYSFENVDKGTWDVWLDVEYPMNDDGEYTISIENIYFDDNGDFNPETDGWRGQKKIDKWVKKAGNVIEGAVNVINSGVDKVNSVVKFASKTIPGFIGAVIDIGSNLQKNFVGTILSFIFDIFRFIADIFQLGANSFQTVMLNTFNDAAITYSAEYLNNDAKGKNKDAGSGNRDIYTKIGKYEKNSKGNENVIFIDDKKEEFTEDTPIPVIPGDLYYIAMGNISLLDTNFLVVNEEIHPKNDTVWIKIRDIASTFIHVSIYISATFLIIVLITRGILIVKSGINNPMEKAKQKEGLQKAIFSVILLVGTVVIMAVTIYGTNAALDKLKMDDTFEGPIRVNVKTAKYSFSTTITGYLRYLTEIENVDKYVQKGLYTLAYVATVAANFSTMIFMFGRVLLIMGLGVCGPIVAVLESISIKNKFNYKAWVILYIKLSLVQIIIALIYKAILQCIA